MHTYVEYIRDNTERERERAGGSMDLASNSPTVGERVLAKVVPGGD